MHLDHLPSLKTGSVSISHTVGMGGFAYSVEWVGFDIEADVRVKPEVAIRVSTLQEFAGLCGGNWNSHPRPNDADGPGPVARLGGRNDCEAQDGAGTAAEHLPGATVATVAAQNHRRARHQ